MDSLENLSLKQRHQLGIKYVPMKPETSSETKRNPNNQQAAKSQKQSSQLFSFFSPIKTNN
jgi:hypothetical protein